MTTQHPTHHPAPKGKSKCQKAKEGKGGEKAVKFTILEPRECDPAIDGIPENEFNVDTRKINLANALGVGQWGEKELGRRLF